MKANVRRRAFPSRPGGNTPLQAIRPTQDICLELRDHTRVTKSAVAFFGSKSSADPAAQAARLADQFITQNAPLFQLLQVSIQRDYDGRDVLLHIDSGSAIGAVPLVSPLTGRQDFGLVVPASISVDWRRPDACGNGVAASVPHPSDCRSKALRTAGTAVGSFVYGVGATQGSARPFGATL